MKKIVLSLFAVISAAALIACGAGTSLDQLSKVFAETGETVDIIDDVDDSDLSNANVNGINSGINFAPQVITVGEETDNGNGKTALEKVAYIIDLHTMIKEKSLEIKSLKSEVKISVNEFKALVKKLKDQGYTLTEEDKAFFSEYLPEAEENYNNLKGTVSKAYRRMHDLRGKYNFSNIDNIIAAFEEVKTTLETRVTTLTRLNEILTEVNARLESLTDKTPQAS